MHSSSASCKKSCTLMQFRHCTLPQPFAMQKLQSCMLCYAFAMQSESVVLNPYLFHPFPRPNNASFWLSDGEAAMSRSVPAAPCASKAPVSTSTRSCDTKPSRPTWPKIGRSRSTFLRDNSEHMQLHSNSTVNLIQ